MARLLLAKVVDVANLQHFVGAQQLLQLRSFTTSLAAAQDALVLKARQQLEEIRSAGTFKVERQITTPQEASVGVLDVAQPVLNFCEYLVAAFTTAVSSCMAVVGPTNMPGSGREADKRASACVVLLQGRADF